MLSGRVLDQVDLAAEAGKSPRESEQQSLPQPSVDVYEEFDGTH